LAARLVAAGCMAWWVVTSKNRAPADITAAHHADRSPPG
jgi:hypothetical protein